MFRDSLRFREDKRDLKGAIFTCDPRDLSHSAVFTRSGGPARAATGSSSATIWKPSGTRFGGHAPMLGGVVRGGPPGECGTGIIAARREATHGECEQDDRQPDGWDKDQQHRAA